ncbi:482_t:CDS:2 [Acaulospora colombiana]|uniref:482_t:CDS:1 n=1 Tax=Acaulospora colombiana TaxID=27376 RepID=A0ACA9KV72_9GLOM|nr:482_t:CDS:2 [Acaulospora colombiana]
MKSKKNLLDLIGRSPPKESVFDAVTISSDLEQNEHSSDLLSTSSSKNAEVGDTNLMKIALPRCEQKIFINGPPEMTTSASLLSLVQVPVELEICSVCFGEFEIIYDLQCNHKFCSECLRKFFLQAKSPTFILPVRCCNKEINMDYAPLVLESEEFQQIIQRISDASYHLFCPTPGCENPIHVNEVFTNDSTSPPISHEAPKILKCPNCNKDICVKCRSHAHPAVPSTGIVQRRPLTSAAVDSSRSTMVPDFTDYKKKNTDSYTNRTFTYLMVGATGVVTASGTKALVTDFLANLSASADVLALAKVEIDLAKIPEGKNVTIKWRGKPVFIRHRTPSEIDEANSVKLSELKDPQVDAERAKRPEWLVMIVSRIVQIVLLVKQC